MTDDSLLDWFLLSPEERRTKEMRSDIAATQAGLGQLRARADRDVARMRTQLNATAASLETRITLLSRAFTAYVELNEVRDQLATLHRDSVDQRRQAISALTRLAAGQSAPRLEPDRDYWLPDAVNAVAAIAAGTPDPESEARARSLEPRADEFVVLAAAAIDRPQQVADRLPEVLVTDGSFSTSQHLLWRAALAGDFGPVVASLEPSVAPGLRTDAWAEWAGGCASAAGMPLLAWLERLTRPVAPTGEVIAAAAAEYLERYGGPRPPAEPRVSRAGRTESQKELTKAMLAMVQEGLPAERDLTTRERTLLAILADPSLGDVTEPPAEVRTDVTDDVREALVDESLDPGARRVLLGWVKPHLRGVLDELTQIDDTPVVANAWVAGRAVVVTPEGHDEARAEQLLAIREGAAAMERTRTLWWSVATGVALVAGIVSVALGQPWGWLVLLLGVGVGTAAYGAWRSWRTAADTAAHDRSAAAVALERARERTQRLVRERAAERGRTNATEELVALRLR